MSFTIARATFEQKHILEHLLELYSHDFSEFIEIDVDEEGRYGYPQLGMYWTEPDRHPFLIRSGEKWAGFVLVRKIAGDHPDAGSYYSIAEFFIIRKYRRSGIGKAVAHEIFRMFPGRWEVFQLTTNLPAQAFWRKTIGEYTGGRYREKEEVGKQFQLFHSP